MPLSPPSTSLSSPSLPRAPLPPRRRRSTPSKHVHFPLHLDPLTDVDQLLQPSPFLPYPSTRPPLLPREKNRQNAAPPRFLARPPAPVKPRKAADNLAEPVLSTANPPVSSKTDQAGVQTSPALARSPPPMEASSPPPLKQSPTGFIATLRDSSNSGSGSTGRARGATRSPFSSSSSSSSRSRSTPPSSASSAHKTSPRSSSPPPCPGPPSSPTAAAQPAPPAPLPRPPLAPPPPAARPRSVTASPSASAPPAPPPPSPSPFSTAGLTPFRLALDSGGKKSRRRGGDGRGETWIELLPPSFGEGGEGKGGEVVLDARAKGEGEVWVVSGDRETMTLFHPPRSPPCNSAPLILLNPLRTFSHAELFPPASSSPPTMASPLVATNDEDAGLVRRARKAWRTVDKVVRVVRSRTVLLSFQPPPSALPSLPTSSSSSSFTQIRLLPTPRPKITLFSDPPAAVSYSVSLSLAISSSGREVKLGVYVSPTRDLVAVSLSSPTTSVDEGAGDDEARTRRWTASLSSLSVRSLSSSAPSASLLDFLSSALSHSHPSSSAAAAASELAYLVLALSNPTGETAQLVGRVRAAHLSALDEPTEEAQVESVTENEDEGGREEGVEAQLVRLLCCILSLPVPPAPPAPLVPVELDSPATRQGEDGDARCLPGLGWILRRRLGPEKGEEGERGREYAVLFADGERVVLRVFLGDEEDGGAEGEKGRKGGRCERVERVEAEDSKGRRYTLIPPSSPAATEASFTPPEPSMPTKLRRRLPLVLELLGLYP